MCLNGDAWCMRVSMVVIMVSLRNLVGVYIPVGRMRLSSRLVIVLQGGCSEICVGGCLHRCTFLRRSSAVGGWKGCMIRLEGMGGWSFRCCWRGDGCG